MGYVLHWFAHVFTFLCIESPSTKGDSGFAETAQGLSPFDLRILQNKPQDLRPSPLKLWENSTLVKAHRIPMMLPSCVGFPASPDNPRALGASPFAKGESYGTLLAVRANPGLASSGTEGL